MIDHHRVSLSVQEDQNHGAAGAAVLDQPSGPPFLAVVRPGASTNTTAVPGARPRDNRTANVSIADQQELRFPQHQISMTFTEALTRLGEMMFLRCWRLIPGTGFLLLAYLLQFLSLVVLWSLLWFYRILVHTLELFREIIRIFQSILGKNKE